MDVALLYDLTTRDGRQAIEVRGVTRLHEKCYASARKTVYSVAYSTQAERILAFGRAYTFCEANKLNLVAYEDTKGGRAVWQ